jgi:hypothetical protein
MDDNEIKDIARDVHHTVVTTGRYKRDSEQWHMPDYWKSYWEGANRGERWEGDCDNFAMTSYVGACERGVPPERVNLIACCVEIFKDGGGHIRTSLADRYHLVCGIDLEDRTLVLDNRYRSATWRPEQLEGYIWSLPEGDTYHHWFMSLNAGMVQEARELNIIGQNCIATMPWRITKYTPPSEQSWGINSPWG